MGMELPFGLEIFDMLGKPSCEESGMHGSVCVEKPGPDFLDTLIKIRDIADKAICAYGKDACKGDSNELLQENGSEGEEQSQSGEESPEEK